MLKTLKSAVQSMREYRSQLGPEKTRETPEKCRNIMREVRKLPKSISQKVAERRVREYRKRQTESRLNLNATEHTTSSPSYKNANPFGKAVKRVQRTLPKSPRKSSAVVRRLPESFNVSVQPVKQSRTSSLTISEETVSKGTEFYCDDISRQLPGKKDFISVREDGRKEHKQKRLLMYNLNDVYSFFQEQNPDVKIELSKFCAMKLKHVMLVYNTSNIESVCLAVISDVQRHGTAEVSTFNVVLLNYLSTLIHP